MTLRPLLLDTCAVIRLFNGSPMADAARAAIAEAAAARCVYVSSFSGREIATLSRKGKIVLSMAPRDWFGFVANHPAIPLASLGDELLCGSGRRRGPELQERLMMVATSACAPPVPLPVVKIS